jgi:hypothetical protein
MPVASSWKLGDVAAEKVARHRSVGRMSAASSAICRTDARFGGLRFANPPYACFGESWEILPLPTQPNATVWGLATHPADGNSIVAFSLFGEVYVSEDAGASWCKIAREFGEIRAAVWVPN